MIFIVGTLLSFAFLDSPWRYVVLLPLALLEIADVLLWLRWRRVRSITGAEGLEGARGRALTDCRPDGQVSIRGQVWKAHCTEGAARGDDVIVRGLEGLCLQVAPACPALTEEHRPNQ
ncbi:MAG: NfeD family protein [Actinomycetota bacterium]|nr:NfeD family protein [Actinomycetota bacterium]